MKTEERKPNPISPFGPPSPNSGKSAIVKFSPDQVSAIMKAEEQKKIIPAPLGLTLQW